MALCKSSSSSWSSFRRRRRHQRKKLLSEICFPYLRDCLCQIAQVRLNSNEPQLDATTRQDKTCEKERGEGMNEWGKRSSFGVSNYSWLLIKLVPEVMTYCRLFHHVLRACLLMTDEILHRSSKGPSFACNSTLFFIWQACPFSISCPANYGSSDNWSSPTPTILPHENSIKWRVNSFIQSVRFGPNLCLLAPKKFPLSHA